jgi:hypothetical protein
MSNRIGIGIDVFGAGIDADATTIYNRIIADGGVSNLSRLNFFVKGLKSIYGDLANVPVCYDAHWIGYKLGSGTGATAGQAAAKLYSLTVAGDAVQATAASQPLLLSHNGSDNYWYGSGVSGNYVASNSNSSFQFNTDFSINLAGIFTSGTILSKFLGSNYVELTQNSGTIRLTYYNGATFPLNIIFGAVSTTVFTYLKLNRVGDIYSLTQSTDNITFTLVGTSTNTTVIPSINSPLYVSNGGAYAGNGGGKFYSIIYHNNGTFSSTVANFNPATYNASTSQTQWTSATGEVWTINTGSASTGYKGVLVDRTIVQGDGVDDKLTASGFSAITLNTRFAALNPINISGGYIIQGRQSGTGDKHLWYQTGGNIQAYTNAGGSINFAGIAANSLKLYSTDFNTTSSNCLTNNVNQVNGTLNSDSFTDLDIFGGGTFKNCVINTLIETSSVSSATQKTAMYNLIRSLNNNSF